MAAQLLIAALGDDACRPRGVGGHDRRQPELADHLAALAERLDVAFDRLDLAELGPAHAHQLMADRQKPLADDVQIRSRQQVMDVGDAAGDRVLDRDHAEIGLAGGDRRQRVLEGRAGQRLCVGKGFGDGDVRIGARLALKRNLLRSAHVRSAFPVLSEHRAGDFEVVRRVDAERHRIDDSRVDPHSGFQRP
jgi:hypothetical protein